MRLPRASDNTIVTLPAKFHGAFALLLDAHDYAQRTGGNPWDFAVEINHLRELGVLENDLRFLVRLNVVAHSREITTANSDGRLFRPTGDLYFTDRTCFILTAKGVAASGNCLSANVENGNSHITTIPSTTNGDSHPADHVPAWDAMRRTLYFEGHTVKRYKYRAANQQTVLCAFQEEGWPTRIDDPLSPAPTVDIKRRLSDTIKCLNRKQQNNLIHFRGDGSGEGVIWESTVGLSVCGNAG